MSSQTDTGRFPTVAKFPSLPPAADMERAAGAGTPNGSEDTAALKIASNNHKTCADADQESILDRPLSVTRFANPKAQHLSRDDRSLRTLAGIIVRQSAPTKAQLPLLKLATFGELKTDRGSLRHDGNLLSVSGIEGDYDAGEVTPQDAAERLRKAGIAALIYTTPSHHPEAPRWRVLAPLSADAKPPERDSLCARLNGALGGILAGESFARSQTYYFGGIGNESPHVELIEGRPLDLASELPTISKRGRSDDNLLSRPVQVDLSALLGETSFATDDEDPFDGWRPEPDWPRIKSALTKIREADDRDLWLRIGQALHHEASGSKEGLKIWSQWSRQSDKFDARDQRRTWQSFGRRDGVTIGSVYHEAKERGWTDGAEPAELAAPARLAFLTPADCEASPARGYLMKGLIAPRDVACIVGAPGAGKSLLAPFLGYAVAQGREAFGMRTKTGSVFYVAAEDAHGMRGRIRALKEAHGDAPAFHLVEGVSDLLSEGSPDLVSLIAAAEERKPSLIIIDTLAMAFPGLEENDAKAMGRVVAVARRLTTWGAAVVLIHHDTKDGAQGLPRGHSILNGALDVALHVKRGEDGVIRGRLTKNRNGACDRDIAFAISTEDGGQDEDGDTITLPRCRELADVGAAFARRMSKGAAAALEVLRSLPQPASEEDWRRAVIDGRIVSAAEEPDSRRRAYKRAVEELGRRGIVVFDGSVYHEAAASDAESAFDETADDIEPVPFASPDKRTDTDKSRTSPDLSTRQTDAQTGRTRTGVLRPVRLSGPLHAPV